MNYEPIVTPPIFSGFLVNAFFTTRTLGCNIDAVSKAFNIPPNNIYLPIQKHTDKVLILDYSLEPKIADAVITNRKDILIGVQTADCVPILLYDKKTHVVGAVHAGWRGTAEGILKKTIEVMVERFYSIPSDIMVATGPAIRWCCYGVGYEVIEAVTRVTGNGDYIIKRGEKYCIDLPTANTYQAISSGVLLDNIWMSGECTFCLPEKYYSYRYAKGATGRQCGFIGIV
ncbi:laccase domain protein [Dissulfurispira thermophila]|uniref:Purine nucleoside phosphorylase n=1 Tax=Dissulfurispira thermophila TaxID=2715679 RepID=A0A7G1H422_9BACT|nr:peptidoglycan editing factor PgeF [Dissulfurispira thermophila]BCB96929.1 laccase domain protein [Dissulfurispira thermophila]